MRRTDTAGLASSPSSTRGLHCTVFTFIFDYLRGLLAAINVVASVAVKRL
jgi:hypothetical protein